eukprot:UN1835
MVLVPTGVFPGGVPRRVDGGHRVFPGGAPFPPFCFELKGGVFGCWWGPSRAGGPLPEFACAWISDCLGLLPDEVPGAGGSFSGAGAGLLAGGRGRFWGIFFFFPFPVG